MEDVKLLKIGKVAEMCGVSTGTIRAYQTKGLLIPTVVLESGHRYYTREQVEAFMNSMAVKKPE